MSNTLRDNVVKKEKTLERFCLRFQRAWADAQSIGQRNDVSIPSVDENRLLALCEGNGEKGYEMLLADCRLLLPSTRHRLFPWKPVWFRIDSNAVAFKKRTCRPEWVRHKRNRYIERNSLTESEKKTRRRMQNREAASRAREKKRWQIRTMDKMLSFLSHQIRLLHQFNQRLVPQYVWALSPAPNLDESDDDVVANLSGIVAPDNSNDEPQLTRRHHKRGSTEVKHENPPPKRAKIESPGRGLDVLLQAIQRHPESAKRMKELEKKESPIQEATKPSMPIPPSLMSLLPKQMSAGQDDCGSIPSFESFSPTPLDCRNASESSCAVSPMPVLPPLPPPMGQQVPTNMSIDTTPPVANIAARPLPSNRQRRTFHLEASQSGFARSQNTNVSYFVLGGGMQSEMYLPPPVFGSSASFSFPQIQVSKNVTNQPIQISLPVFAVQPEIQTSSAPLLSLITATNVPPFPETRLPTNNIVNSVS